MRLDQEIQHRMPIRQRCERKVYCIKGRKVVAQHEFIKHSAPYNGAEFPCVDFPSEDVDADTCVAIEGLRGGCAHQAVCTGKSPRVHPVDEDVD